LLVYLYNKQVTRVTPKSIDDLLQPRWKGKLGMDKDADDWLAAIADY
jgi:ABC-type Fe3+ transport system substrate-binding protein